MFRVVQLADPGDWAGAGRRNIRVGRPRAHSGEPLNKSPFRAQKSGGSQQQSDNEQQSAIM